MTDKKETAAKSTAAKTGASSEASLIEQKDKIVVDQMTTGVVDVVETNQAAPKEGWNKEIEINNLVDPNSTNLPGPRSRVDKTGGVAPRLNVVGSDVEQKNAEVQGPADNGNVLDEGLVTQGEKR